MRPRTAAAIGRPAAAVGLRPCAAVVGALLAATPCLAFEWSYTPAVVVGAGYDTNTRLEPTDQLQAGAASLTAEADIAGRNEGFEVLFAPRVTSLHYDDDQQLDRDDSFANLSIAKHDDRQRWSLGGMYAREGTLTTEFEDTGFVETDVDRIRSTLSTSWARTAERGAYDLALSSTGVDYEEALLSPLVDYRHGVFQAGYTRTTSERSSWRFGVSRMRMSSEGTGLETLSTDARVTWSHAFSTALQARVGLGTFEVVEQGGLGADSSGTSLDFNVDRFWPRWRFSAKGGRELQPDGRGALVREDSARLTMLRTFTERFSVGASLLAAQVRSVGSSTDAYDRDYSQSSVTWQWRLRRHWSLDGAFYERAQESPTFPQASGFISQISASYRGL